MMMMMIITSILQVRKLTPRERESRCKETGETRNTDRDKQRDKDRPKEKKR